MGGTSGTRRFHSSMSTLLLMSARRPAGGRPSIRFRAGPTHEHRALAVAQAVGLEEGLRGLLVVEDPACARPVGAPQAAIETPRVEHARERVPDIRVRIRLAGERAGAA